MLNDRLLDTQSFPGRTGKMFLSIAGINCAIISQDTSFLDLIRERYCRFVSSGPATYEILLQCLLDDVFTSDATEPPFYPPVKRVNSGNNYLIKQTIKPFLAVANTSSKKVLVKLSHNQSCFDNFLRMLFTLILAEESGLMLHASAVSEKGQANIFFGPSGSGKTTVARLSRERKILTDELVIIKPHNGRFRVYATPFWDEYMAGQRNARAALQALYSLKKDRRNNLKTLDKIQAVMALYKCVSFFTDDHRLLRRVFNTCCNIVDTVPAYELHFRPDPSFWQLMQKPSQKQNTPVHACTN